MKKKSSLIFLFWLTALAAGVFIVSGAVLASQGQTLPNPLGTIDIPTIIGRVIKAFLGVVGAIALIMFVYGGFMWLTAAGNEARVEKGRNTLMWAAIGLVIVFISWMLVGFLMEALGV